MILQHPKASKEAPQYDWQVKGRVNAIGAIVHFVCIYKTLYMPNNSP